MSGDATTGWYAAETGTPSSQRFFFPPPMDIQQFKRVEEIFEAATALPPEQREAHIAEACGGDETLRRRVMRMLDHATQDLVCDDLPSLQGAASRSVGAVDNLVGAAFGRYRLVELVGEGGFGAVYRAEQTAPVRRMVAFKIIKLGMDTAAVIRRFEAERQALALMDHPHIARVFDAGATDLGRPYFVMELVSGVPITRYCDQNLLSLRDRLTLFMQVCQAVQHAHGKGVIHRDIKPSNVLVAAHEGVATPKIIDFGIAKATHGRLGDETFHTEARQFIGTPEYMSPEQASAGQSGMVGDVDTRSDVYALGVLLHELLVGVTPLGLHRIAHQPREEVLRLIREQDPGRPSTRMSALGDRIDEIARLRRTEPRMLRRALRGDLDLIVLKCMEKDPERRYETAADLAHEVQRYLNNEPILARPPGAAYLMRKFVRRHKVGVVAAALITLALIAGLIAALIGLTRAHEATRDQKLALKVSEDRLWDSLLAQARAARSGREIGRRFQALGAIRMAAGIRPSAELRDEALACMSLADFGHRRSLNASSNVSARGLRVIDRLADAPQPGVVQVLSVEDGRELVRMSSPTSTCWTLQFSPDGRYLAGKFHDQPDDVRFVIWDTHSGAETLHLSEGCTVRDALAFCVIDGQPAAAVGGGASSAQGGVRMDFYALASGERIGGIELPHFALACVADESGTRLAVSHFEHKVITIWDLPTRQQSLRIESPAAIRGMIFTHDGSRLIGCGQDYNLHVWRASDGAYAGALRGHQGDVFEVFLNADSTIVGSVAWDNTSRLWTLETMSDAPLGHAGQELTEPLLNVRIAGLGDVLVTNLGAGASVWAYEPAREFRRLRPEKRFGTELNVHMGGDGTLMATASAEGIRLWDAREGREVATASAAPASFAHLMSDGRRLLGATDTGVHRWVIQRSDDGSIGLTIPSLVVERRGIRGCSIDASERWLVITAVDSIEVIDLFNGRTVVTLPGYPGLDRESAIDRSGRWLFTGNWRGSGGRLWDLQSQSAIREFPGLNVEAAFNPEGTRLLVSDGSMFELLDTTAWKSVYTRQRNNVGGLAGHMSVSADGRIAAIMHSRFETHIIELESGRTLARLLAPAPAAVSSIALSGDGGMLAASTSVSELHIWNIAAMREGLRVLRLDWE